MKKLTKKKQVPKAKQTSAKRPPKKLKYSAFVLAGHAWLPASWHLGSPDIIRSVGAMVLVRTGEGTEQFAKPTEAKSQIQKWSARRHGEETKRFFESDREATANLFVRAEVSKDAMNCIGIKTRVLMRQIIRLAEDGNADAAQLLATISMETCRALSKLGKEQPRILRPTARRSWKWPVIKSLHPFLSDDHDGLLKSLQLGADTPVEVHPSARWKPDEVGQIAFSLLLYVWRSRSENRKQNIDYGALGKLADRLDPFTDDSSDDWWKLGKAVFLVSYPEPEKIRELTDLITAASKRKSPGRLRFAILNLLKSRFVSLAPPS